MLSSLFQAQSRRPRRRADQSQTAPSSTGPATRSRHARDGYDGRRALHYADEAQLLNSSSNDEQYEQEDEDFDRQELDDSEEDGAEISPLLPIFDSTHLDTLPVYALTHTVRQMVSDKCDTVLTWEQLRSPQVSQFLLRPIQQELKEYHLSATSIYCLMANCLQYTKEIDIFPGNSGTSQTRAMVCELLAIKLLLEYTTRGLIDALSYRFDPLQGQPDISNRTRQPYRQGWQSVVTRNQMRSTRVSCLEIAIRAQAKRFLAHPMVVQQLNAIWDGSIVFHAAADSVHHRKPITQTTNYGTAGSPRDRFPQQFGKGYASGVRKVVTLYDPKDASPFKLSRLRVPRYRDILSTFSFAILLCLFVAVLVQRSTLITPLEVVFWFWATGYMMDELVGFTEQGFGLYLASFWNTIDFGIVLILIAHLCLRIYGLFLPNDKKRATVDMAFDLLAADAILLFPRIFSVLDHYRYFSQLIIAFRWMAADAAAVFVLIAISFSGFFVALTLSFGYDGKGNAADVAYALLQMIMGYTPAVWDRWANYTYLGRFILVIALVLTQFLILTILITVLTNSFMAVVKNAHEEHQFIFAVNTIAIVKSHSLFAYIPPLNVLQWVLTPLKYALPIKHYVQINRTIIKITHFPVLFFIYFYEKTILQTTAVDRIDLVQNRRTLRSTLARRLPRLGQKPSIANFRQDQALEEVFKQPFDATLRTEIFENRKKSRTAVSKWMHSIGKEDVDPPEEDDPKTVDRLESKRTRRLSRHTFSVASEPGGDIVSHAGFLSPLVCDTSTIDLTPSGIDLQAQNVTVDGDKGFPINDKPATNTRDADAGRSLPNIDYFTNHTSSLVKNPHNGSNSLDNRVGKDRVIPSTVRPIPHKRIASSATIIHHPTGWDDELFEDSVSPTAKGPRSSTPGSKGTSSSSKKTPKPKKSQDRRPSISNDRYATFRSAPDLQHLLRSSQQLSPRHSALAMDIVSDIGDNKAIGGGYVGAIPASFATQMAYEVDLDGLREQQEESEMFGRLMMARMNTLEEGFRDVIHEMRENLKSNAGSRARSPDRPVQVRREKIDTRKDNPEEEMLDSNLGGTRNDTHTSSL